MSELLQSGQHPDADQLSAFMEHALPAHEQEETLAHLAICPHCRSIVALSLPPAELPVAHPEPVRPPWLSGWMMAWPAGVALAALVLAGIYIRSGFVVEKHVTPVQTAQSTAPAPHRQLQPPLSLELQKSGKVTPRSAPGPAAPAPQSALTSEALDRLMPIPSDDRRALHLNQNQSPVFGAAKAENRATPARVVAGQHSLPSGLTALSTVANAEEAVAIDTQHTLFFSNDGGAHWSVISQPWQGRAVKVELVPPSYSAGTRNGTLPAAGFVGGIGLRASLAGPRATLSGKITDPTGASVPNVSVVVTNSSRQVVHRTTTDSDGRYTLDQLDPGTYTLEAGAPGFTPREISELSVHADQQNQKDLTLVVGASAQTVEVQGAAQPALATPKVKEEIAATPAPAPPVPQFEITTDAGEHWISTDGRFWQRKDK